MWRWRKNNTAYLLYMCLHSNEHRTPSAQWYTSIAPRLVCFRHGRHQSIATAQSTTPAEGQQAAQHPTLLYTRQRWNEGTRAIAVDDNHKSKQKKRGQHLGSMTRLSSMRPAATRVLSNTCSAIICASTGFELLMP